MQGPDTGCLILLATPPQKKTESQTWGEGKKQSPRTPPMSGTLFFCTLNIVMTLNILMTLCAGSGYRGRVV